jgi:energy-coupling factor transport system substrate-specific component
MTHPISQRWRTVDIVVAAVIAVAFGVVFWAWNLLWSATGGVFGFYAPAQALLYGVWLVPAVLAGLVIRKPGAAVFTETVAAFLSMLSGEKWGVTVVPQGLIEGLGAELAFAIFLYRAFGLPVAALSGALAGLGATLFDAFYWNRAYSWLTYNLPYIGFGVLSSLLVAGVGGWALARALAQTGVLDRFPAGRDRMTV